MKLRRYGMIALVGIMLIAAVLACSGGTRTETITEAELNEEMAGSGLAVDLKPGVILMYGDIEGFEVELEMELFITEGNLGGKITSATFDGEPVDVALFADVNQEMASSIFADENYSVTSVEITEDEIVIEAESK